MFENNLYPLKTLYTSHQNRDSGTKGNKENPQLALNIFCKQWCMRNKG
jgi:hypothetical protein